jgi:hypothetical protein
LDPLSTTAILQQPLLDACCSTLRTALSTSSAEFQLIRSRAQSFGAVVAI